MIISIRTKTEIAISSPSLALPVAALHSLSPKMKDNVKILFMTGNLMKCTLVGNFKKSTINIVLF